MTTPQPDEVAPLFGDDEAAASFLFKSLQRAMASGKLSGPDAETRDLSPTRDLLERLGNPGVASEFLLVTGSKGKGSTAAIISKVLEALGFRVGLMTSPSLVNFRERVRVNGQAIPADEWIALVERIVPHVENIDAELPSNRYFSPTGMILAIALMHFEQSGVDVAVIEAGRGGRYDDTRLVENTVSVITPVMLEHAEELGPTLADIAWHKAGVVKPGGILVSARQPQEALTVIEGEAEALGVEVCLLGREFEAALVGGGDLERPGLRMTLRTARQDYGEVWVPLLGRYQVENTAVAVSAVEALLDTIGEMLDGHTLAEAVRNGVGGVQWPGRCQVLDRSPLVVLDGAINEESATLFRESVVDLLRPPVAAVVAVPVTKDYEGVFREVAKLAKTVILTRFDTAYLTFPANDEALRTANQFFERALVQSNFSDAYAAAEGIVGHQGTVLIVGTQSLVKAALRQWGHELEMI